MAITHMDNTLSIVTHKSDFLHTIDRHDKPNPYLNTLSSDQLQPSSQSSTTAPYEEAPNTLPEDTKEIAANTSTLIWVPADKHPQIAPSEFSEWIRTNGTDPLRRASKVRRKKSQLSVSHTSEDEKDDAESTDDEKLSIKSRRTSSRKRNDESLTIIREEDGDSQSHVLDGNIASNDDSPVVAPQQSRSLLRRSALSSRRGVRRTSINEAERKRRGDQDSKHTVSQHTIEEVEDVENTELPTATPAGGVRLYDRPVSISEWIDLGSASFSSDDSQQGILSRVHDAETLLFPQILEDCTKEKEEEEKQPTLKIEKQIEPSEISPELVPEKTLPTEESSADRPSLNQSGTGLTPIKHSKKEKKLSWLVGLLHEKKARSSLRRVDDERANKATKSVNEKKSNLSHVDCASSSVDSPRKPSLLLLFTRSLSMKSLSPKCISRTTERESVAKKRTSRLDIPPQYINTYRLPIHIERAIYRLSHMKLSSPRRPLHHQVLISNFMFWYLSIDHTQSQAPMEDVPSEPETKKSAMSRIFFSARKRRDDGVPRNNAPRFPNNSSNATGATSLRKSLNAANLKQHRRQVQFESDDDDDDDNVPLKYYKK
ncbi:hypothetical protein EC973_002305 [Apophysomyces ossiformis]|uniref:Protein Zds1 C-terminal domain-containing protein n=1 Tax=Apophysomyces ossiformis TaxID=679940 RepID=A0A8H7ERB4_9FUNG|nr:hypothetical protein EC973_002305 [Apophysomyces ossiformis]